MRLSRLSAEELKHVAIDLLVPEDIRTDVQMLAAIAQLWGGEALGRIRFDPEDQPATTSRLDALLQPFRH